MQTWAHISDAAFYYDLKKVKTHIESSLINAQNDYPKYVYLFEKVR